MNPNVDVIEILQRANPVPPGTLQGDHPSQDEFLGSQSERHGGLMSSPTITKAPTRGTSRRVPPKYLGAAAAVVLVVASIIPIVTGPIASGVDWGEVPAGQRQAVEQVVNAINERDASAFASNFDPEGTFSMHIQFEMRSSCCDSYPVADSSLLETWMRVSEVWGLEAELHACEAEGDQTVRCRVTNHWEALRMEMPEEWLFVFDGSEVRSFGMLVRRTDEAPTTMPLAYTELADWERWLRANHPEQASRLLPEGGMLSIDGVAYESIVLRYDPALVDEIGASIDEYLAAR